MEKLTQGHLAIITNINRRDFLKISGGAASIAGGVLLTNLGLASPLPSASLDKGKVTSVWVNNQGANNWNQYYGKFLRLMNQQHSNLDTQWIKADKKILLKITMDKMLGYPYSADPKLVYSMVRYLINEKSIPAKNIIISDQSFSKKSSGLTQQLAQLRTSGIYSGLRRALPLKKTRSLKSQNTMPLKWLSSDNDFDHIIELASLTRTHNRQRINDINGQFNQPTVQSSIHPKITISSATKICCGEHNHRKIINQQPGMILASNNSLSHELLANAYLNFCSAQALITTDKGYTTLTPYKQHAHSNPLHKTIFEAMKQQGHLAELDWYNDEQDAPTGAIEKITSNFFQVMAINNYTLT